MVLFDPLGGSHSFCNRSSFFDKMVEGVRVLGKWQAAEGDITLACIDRSSTTKHVSASSCVLHCLFSKNFLTVVTFCRFEISLRASRGRV